MRLILTFLAVLPVLWLLHGVARASHDGPRLSLIERLRYGWACDAGELIFDLVDPQELLGFIRTLEFPDLDFLGRWLPDDNIEDLEYRFNTGNLVDQDVATYRAFDTPATIAKRQGISRVVGELPPLSRKIRLGEEERLRLRALLGGGNDALIDAIYNDAVNMVRAVRARVALARGQAIWQGMVSIAENGAFGEVEFGVPNDHFVAPATVWSNPASTPVSDMRTWVEKYVDDNGAPPEVALTSTQVISGLLRNDEIRTLAGSQAGTPGIVTPEVVQAVFQAFGLPPFVPYDAKVRVDGVATRITPNDRVVLLPAGSELGRTAYGITAEALELAEQGQIVANQAPGIVAVVEKTFDPVARWTKAAAIALPLVENPSMILSADVI